MDYLKIVHAMEAENAAECVLMACHASCSEISGLEMNCTNVNNAHLTSPLLLLCMNSVWEYVCLHGDDGNVSPLGLGGGMVSTSIPPWK